MRSEWKEYYFEDVSENFDKKRVPLSSAQRAKRRGIYPYYGAQGVIDLIDDYIFDGTYLLIAEDGENLKSKKQLIAQLAHGKFWVNNHAHIVSNNYLSDINFLCYKLNSIDISGYVTGSAQPKLSQSNMNHILLTMPPLAEQKAIAAVLSALDAKIELNNRINKNLEAQAQAIFKSWFVDFEPFRDGEFVDSELGPIPKGWKVSMIGNVTTEIKKRVKSANYPVLSAIKEGELVLSEEYFTKQVYSKDISKYIVVAPNEFAYNPSRINIGSLGMNKFSLSGCVSPIYVVFTVEKNYHLFFDLYFKSPIFKQYSECLSSGSVRQSMKYSDFSIIRVIYPPQNVIEKFNMIYKYMLSVINHNKEQNRTLAAIRDTLLPKLMGGEIRVPLEV